MFQWTDYSCLISHKLLILMTSFSFKLYDFFREQWLGSCHTTTVFSLPFKWRTNLLCVTHLSLSHVFLTIGMNSETFTNFFSQLSVVPIMISQQHHCKHSWRGLGVLTASQRGAGGCLAFVLELCLWFCASFSLHCAALTRFYLQSMRFIVLLFRMIVIQNCQLFSP